MLLNRFDDAYLEESENRKMTFFDLFKGPTPEKLEQKGDGFYDTGNFGNAKLLFERALDKSEKKMPADTVFQKRLADKIDHTKNALAMEHRKAALNFLEGGYIDDALSMIALALEVAADVELIKELELLRHDIGDQQVNEDIELVPILNHGGEEPLERMDKAQEKTYFVTLLNTLPEALQTEYPTYGSAFRTGYTALNNGEFDKARVHPERTMYQNPEPESYIPFELATTYFNLNLKEKARNLLEIFVGVHPEVLPAYQMLCEIYWEHKDFYKADTLLSTISSTIEESVAVFILKGTTLFYSGQPGQAKHYYETRLQTYGWNDTLAGALAEICEALDEKDQARDYYKEIMGRCTSCHSIVDPFIQQKYADISFEMGIKTNEILELYLSLARDLPENRVKNFQRISRIYKSMGNRVEAERFDAFSQRAKKEQTP